LAEFENSPLCELIGDYSRDKQIPKFVFEAPKYQQRIFIQSYMEGDGSINLGKKATLRISASSRSLQLLKELQILLLTFGVRSQTREMNRGENQLVITRINNVTKFLTEIGFVSKKVEKSKYLIEKFSQIRVNSRRSPLNNGKIPGLKKFVLGKVGENGYCKKYNIDNIDRIETNYNEITSSIHSEEVLLLYEDIIKKPYFYEIVKSCEKEKEEHNVYSIRVDSKCHSFIANGFINHNTEIKLSKFGESLLEDISEDTVEHKPTYNDEMMEPTVLPGKLPNLLLNGCNGIAVGWATNIPPHNLREVAAVIKEYLQDSNLSISRILQLMPGPDFPTGGKILGQQGVKKYYLGGRGSVTLEGTYEVTPRKNGGFDLVITELPYQTAPSEFTKQVIELVNSNEVTGITDMRDLSSNKNGMRIWVEIGKFGNPNLVLNVLLKRTSLRKTFSVNQTVLIDGKVVENATLLELVAVYVKHREEVINKKLLSEKDKNLNRTEVLKGFKSAIDRLDETIRIIRASDDAQDAKNQLIGAGIVDSEKQADAVLAITLKSLTKMEAAQLDQEMEKLKKRLEWLENTIGNQQEIRKIIVQDLDDAVAKYGDDRRCIISQDVDNITDEDLIADEKVVVSLTGEGYLKTNSGW
jgi:DNA gyrase subunit A